MANWYGTCRSNYVRVRDPDAFRKLLGEYPLRIIEKDGRLGFVSEDDSGIPERYTDDMEDEPISILDEPWTEILAEGEVLIVQEVGAEKSRYVTGRAWAYCQNGDTNFVDLYEIYEGLPDDVTRAEY